MAFSDFHIWYIAIYNVSTIVIIKHTKRCVFGWYAATSRLVWSSNFCRTAANVAVLAGLYDGTMNIWNSFDDAVSSTELCIVRGWIYDPIPADIVEVNFKVMQTAQIATSSSSAGAR